MLYLLFGIRYEFIMNFAGTKFISKTTILFLWPHEKGIFYCQPPSELQQRANKKNISESQQKNMR